jgi:low temperature requirement protein LtrA
MMSVSDQVGLLRSRAGGAERVTPLELFFDLVYVFAVTQLSHRLLEHLTIGNVLETLMLLLVVGVDRHDFDRQLVRSR